MSSPPAGPSSGTPAGTGSATRTPSPPRANYVYVPETMPYTGEPHSVFDYHSLDGTDPTICIDPGSHSWRAGFSSMSTPWIDRPNVVSRYRDRKVGRNTLLFGQDVEVDANSRSNGRSMYDGDMLIHSDLLVSCARWKES